MITVLCIFMSPLCYSAVEYVFIDKWHFTNVLLLLLLLLKVLGLYIQSILLKLSVIEIRE